jgi:hypothetical protein
MRPLRTSSWVWNVLAAAVADVMAEILLTLWVTVVELFEGILNARNANE